MPSTTIFSKTEFDFATLEHRLRELAFLNSGAKIVITDARHADVKTVDLVYDGEVFTEYPIARVPGRHTHGTGCTFSAALAALDQLSLVATAVVPE